MVAVLGYHNIPRWRWHCHRIEGRRILVDCGVFQGFKQLRLRNWDRPPVDPATIDAVILTHAHLDHSGYLPLLCRSGFKGPIICTGATRDLSAILLPDSGHLQERDAELANRHGFSKHKPALPLYTEAEARHCLAQFRPTDFGTPIALRRLIPSAPGRLPDWAQEPSPRALLAALLAGGWDDESEGDKAKLAELAGQPYDQAVGILASYVGELDRPLRKIGSTWRVASAKGQSAAIRIG